ncbi:Mesenchymal stem cell protein DSCD75 [Minicystis rosea]|nr:Mesenchymal stem cell protein DSCD75 [Minicystis rosea]
MIAMARLGWAGIRALGGPAVGPLDVSRIPLRVVPMDLDAFGHVTNSRYLSMMDAGRMDLVVRSGWARVAYRERVLPLVGAAYLRFKQPLVLWDRVELETQVVCWDEKYFFIEQRFRRAKRICALGLVRMLFTSERRHVAPASMIAQSGRDTSSPPMPEWITRWCAMERAA